MKKLINNKAAIAGLSALIVALFAYTSYSFYYVYISWTNMFEIVLYWLLFFACFFVTGAIASFYKKTDVAAKTAVRDGLICAVSHSVVLWGLLRLINNVIGKEKLNVLAIRITLSVSFLMFTIVMFVMFVRLAKKGLKPLFAVMCVLVIVGSFAGTEKLLDEYYTYRVLYPAYRVLINIGGVRAEDRHYRYDFAYTTEKLHPTDTLGKNNSFNICLAKNEYESCQLAIACTKKGVVSLSVSDFTDVNGNTIKPSLYREVFTSVPGYDNTFSNEYPDALLPYENEQVELKKNLNEIFLIEIKSDKDTPAGAYTANVKAVDENGNELFSTAVSATVWDFALPDKPSMETAMGIFSGAFWTLNGLESVAFGQNSTEAVELTQEQQQLYKSYYDYLLERRISPYTLPYDILDERADAYMSDERVTSFCMPYPDDDDKLVEYYEKVMSNPEWAKKAYFYPIDEPADEKAYETYNEMTQRLERLCPGYNMVTPFFKENVTIDGTEYSSVELQLGKSSILCPLSELIESANVREELSSAKEQNSQIWWYVCCEPTGDYANFFIHQNGLQHRILFWQQYDYEIDGFLYYDTVNWGFANPWESSKTLTSYENAGDGCLMYPGRQVDIDGPVGTFRLVNIVNGLEDYEYFTLASAAAGSSSVSDLVAKVSSTLTDYTELDDNFESVRRSLAEIILSGNAG